MGSLRTSLGARADIVLPAALLLLLGTLTLTRNPALLGGGFIIRPLMLWVLVGAGWVAMAVALFALRASGRVRFAALVALILAAVFLPTMALMVYRWQTGVPARVHDGMFQTELVIGRLLQGHDPYGTDFTQTEIMRWPMFLHPGLESELHHYAYFPLVVLSSIPVYLMEHALGLIPDLRPLLLVFSAAALVLIMTLPWSWTARYVLIAGLFLDPFFSWVDGRNDILWLTPLLAGAWLLMRDRWRAAAWAFGTAGAFKMLAIPFLPFVAVALYVRWRGRLLTTRSFLVGLLGLAAPLALSSAPFLVWNATAFLRDNIGWLIGLDSQNFPITGYGLGGLLLAIGVIPSPSSHFPFGVIQAVVGVPILALGILRLARTPTSATLLDSGATLTAALLFFGRSLNDNYVASLLVLFLLGLWASHHERLENAMLPVQRKAA